MKSKIFLILIFILFEIIGFSQCLTNESDYKNYFKENLNKLDQIEGIYSISSTYTKYLDGELIGTNDEPNSATCSIIRNGQEFILCYSPSNYSVINYSKFSSTAIEGLYLWKNSNSQFNVVDGANAKLTNGKLLQFTYKGSREEIIQHYKEASESYQREHGGKVRVSQDKIDDLYRKTQLIHEYKLIKIFPTGQEKIEAKKNEISSGTGFAISSKPYIVTNYHVIEGAREINVRGINNEYSLTYPADIVLIDKNNDLAILKIRDEKIIVNEIPYTISGKLSDVGENIFVLGYPLRATMGDELKLTNGIISSRTGFQTDISTYQISAPVQPGNSGGPVFNSDGVLIGIINAKHIGAENVSYAIKTTYLLNLIDLLSEKVNSSKFNQLAGKSLPEQVKVIRNFVYIIESN